MNATRTAVLMISLFVGCGDDAAPPDSGPRDGGARLDAAVDAAGTDARVPPPDAACDGCWNGVVCEPGNDVVACGLGGVSCASCDDGAECTADTCIAGRCESEPDDAATCTGGSCHAGACCAGCWDGAACQPGDTTSVCGAAGGACAGCTPDADPCTDDVCMGGSCTALPSSTATCPGGGCHAGVCCTSCWDGAACQPGSGTGACGEGGAICEDCDDANECTSDSCESMTCEHFPYGPQLCASGRCHGGACCDGCFDGSSCTAGPSVIDAQQLECVGFEFLSLDTETVGQSFQVSRNGTLAAIEVTGSAAPGVSQLALTLYEETSGGLVMLGTGTEFAARPSGLSCLSATDIGVGYFEMPCVPVFTGRTYRFVLNGGTMCRIWSAGSLFETCSSSSGALRCTFDGECNFRVSQSSNRYAGGTMYRGTTAVPTNDLAFKVFMMP